MKVLSSDFSCLFVVSSTKILYVLSLPNLPVSQADHVQEVIWGVINLQVISYSVPPPLELDSAGAVQQVFVWMGSLK